ncbi:MAG TPA: NADH-quinone oxidoreductase subunit J [Mycobacteriales bacterium]|nr:NADH-quinone oxidoreductase subunit J [Mycobacteriales bacterium]
MTGQLLAAAGDMSTGESVVFAVLSIVAVTGGVGMVLARSAVHSALFLVMTMFSLGVFYFVQQGPFLGVVQIIVYTGAIMILFLFVLMLVGRDSADSLVETLRGQRTAALVLGLGFAGLVGGAVYRGVRDITPVGLPNVTNNVQDIAALLFRDYVFAFELTSALLITAAVGAMVLAHVERERGEKPTQKELARQRFRGTHPQPEPGPGVFATSNSIATPALLPDGTVAEGSVSRLVEPNLAGVTTTLAELEGDGNGVAPTDTAVSTAVSTDGAAARDGGKK